MTADLIRKLSPYSVPGYSPTMYRIIGAATGVPINSLDARPYRSFAVTSDGFVIAQPGQRESGDFIGSYADFVRNVRNYLDTAGLDAGEREVFLCEQRARIVDWRGSHSALQL